MISALHKEITGTEVVAQSFQEFSASWLARKAPEVAPGTLAFYKGAVKKFSNYLDIRAGIDIAEITAEDIVGFRNHEAEALSAKTVNHDLKCLRMLFHAARRDAVIADDPCEFVNVAKKSDPMRRRRPFTVLELKSVLSVADDEWKSLVLFGLYTGQRLGDLAMLTWENIDLLRGEIRLVTRKTRKTMIIPIAASLRAYIGKPPIADAPGTPMHPRAFAIVDSQGKTGHLSNQFADLLAKAGLREKKTHRKTGNEGVGRGIGSGSGGLSFHCIRHTAVHSWKTLEFLKQQ